MNTATQKWTFTHVRPGTTTGWLLLLDKAGSRIFCAVRVSMLPAAMALAMSVVGKTGCIPVA